MRAGAPCACSSEGTLVSCAGPGTTTARSPAGRQHPVKARQVEARSRHQSCQALHELQRRHPEVRGPVAPGALQLQHDVTRRIFLEPLVGDRGAGDVAAQPFERFALMRAT